MPTASYRTTWWWSSGGVGGVIAAVTAARHGLRVALVNDRPGLGGNASSDIGASIDGAICFNAFPNMREGGPLARSAV